MNNSKEGINDSFNFNPNSFQFSPSSTPNSPSFSYVSIYSPKPYSAPSWQRPQSISRPSTPLLSRRSPLPHEEGKFPNGEKHEETKTAELESRTKYTTSLDIKVKDLSTTEKEGTISKNDQDSSTSTQVLKSTSSTKKDDDSDYEEGPRKVSTLNILLINNSPKLKRKQFPSPSKSQNSEVKVQTTSNEKVDDIKEFRKTLREPEVSKSKSKKKLSPKDFSLVNDTSRRSSKSTSYNALPTTSTKSRKGSRTKSTSSAEKNSNSARNKVSSKKEKKSDNLQSLTAEEFVKRVLAADIAKGQEQRIKVQKKLQALENSVSQSLDSTPSPRR